MVCTTPSASHPATGAHSLPQDHLAGFWRLLCSRERMGTGSGREEMSRGTEGSEEGGDIVL